MDRYVMRCAAVVLLMGTTVIAAGGVVAEWDFSKGTQGWSGNNKVEPVGSTAEGLVVRSTGEDPWIEGPAIDFPSPDGMARVTIRMKSTSDRGGELFYGRQFSGDRSVRFTVNNDGNWHEYVLMIPQPLGVKSRFRLDPCSFAGELTVAWIRVEALKKMEPPVFEKPVFTALIDSSSLAVKSGNLTVRHSRKAWGDFLVAVDDKPFACGYASEIIGLLIDDQVQWINLKNATAKVDAAKNTLRVVAEVKDKGGCTWRLTRVFGIGEKGTLSVETTVQVDQDRQAVLVPWLTMFAGAGTFGEKKHQGLFAGLEYLQDEPSSSEADIAAPANVRRIPDSYKVTFPLMTIQQNGHYIGLIWDRDPMVAAGFDSPDRVFGSGGHAMWLSGPGTSAGRFENELCAHSPMTIAANKPITAKALIIGGKGETIIPAVQQYVALRGWPKLPTFEGGFLAAVDLLSHGWLDSKITGGGLYRHAVWGNSFGPQAAADAAMFQKWLAETTGDGALRERLTAGSKQAVEKLSPSDTFGSGVSHVRFPTAPLVFGRVPEYVRQRVAQARAELKQFDADGKIIYKPRDVDYGRTHFENHANGIGGAAIADVLEAATLCPEPSMVAEALKVLDQQTKLYAGTIPRGAQTWECPLHTPDILASAHMVKAYTLGYLLSGKPEHLEQARYWAWTGVPFVYLSNPTEGRVGEYATIAVLCATNWRAPVWFGQPVQWCGLVYGSALHQLAQVDPQGPWLKLAQGITIAGLQESWPTKDAERQGLLPDYFLLNDQVSDGPAINPGTVGAHLPEAYGQGKLYDVRKIAGLMLLVHAPCEITSISEQGSMVKFEVAGWKNTPVNVLISGMDKQPKQIRSNGTTIVNATFDAELKLCMVPITGKTSIEIEL
jgi:hypothetical protein